MKNKITILCLLIFVFSSINIANANSPDGIIFDYDFDFDILYLRINHVVSDPNTHYIELVQIYVNNILNITREYTSQNTTAYLEDNYALSAVHGDVIKVTATCNIVGSLTDQITLDDPAVSEFGFLVPIVFFAIIGSIFGWKIHKRHEKE